MPRLNAATPKYRKHKASGQAIVTIAGRDHYLGPWKSKASIAEYDRLIAEWLAAGRPSHVDLTKQLALTVNQLIVAHWRYLTAYYRTRPASAENCKPALCVLRRLYGHTPAAEFGPLALKAVLAQFVKLGQNRTYCNMNLSRIKRVFKWGVSEQLIPADVYHGLVTVEGLKKNRSDAPEPKAVEPVTDATVQATLPYLPRVVADMVRFQKLTGCRPGEVCALRPCEVDRSHEVWVYRPQTHKTSHHDKERAIFIGPKAQNILRRYLLREAETHCFSPQDTNAKLLASRRAGRQTPDSCGNRPGTNRKCHPKRTPGSAYNSDSYRRSVHRAADKAGVERWSPNQLRHSTATEIRQRFGLEAAQVSLGHASANVTQVYAQRDLLLAREVASKIG